MADDKILSLLLNSQVNKKQKNHQDLREKFLLLETSKDFHLNSSHAQRLQTSSSLFTNIKESTGEIFCKLICPQVIRIKDDAKSNKKVIVNGDWR